MTNQQTNEQNDQKKNLNEGQKIPRQNQEEGKNFSPQEQQRKDRMGQTNEEESEFDSSDSDESIQ